MIFWERISDNGAVMFQRPYISKTTKEDYHQLPKSMWIMEQQDNRVDGSCVGVLLIHPAFLAFQKNT
jgi:hypothetical protein